MRTLKSANGATAVPVFLHKDKDQWVPRLGSFLPRRTRTLKAANAATAISVFLGKLKVSGYRGWGLSCPGE
uniref:B8 n=1 Tax=Human betaherpesvirus 6 TaxID=10368 RepID=A0A5P9UM61_9BETA|nr:B8 [Human betaherpesvirus 6]